MHRGPFIKVTARYIQSDILTPVLPLTMRSERFALANNKKIGFTYR